MTFIDKSINQIADIIKTSYVYWETAGKSGLFQRLDPRVKIVFMLFFIILVSMLRSIRVELALSFFLMILISLSRLDMLHLYRRIIGFAFFFGLLIALPSAFNVITRGEIVIPVATLSRSYHWWIYTIPAKIGMTREGLFGVAMLTLRVMNSVSITLLVIYTTPFFEIIRALKVFRVPDTFLMIIILTYKYIFIFSKTVEDMYRAMKARLAGPVDGATIRGILAGRIFFLFKKSQMQYEETYRAMLCRGFSGDVMLVSFRKLTVRDAAAGVLFALAGMLFIMMQVYL
ncbi:MAG TPA: cobalt ECF transporter T component CbiQ [Spirochaetota bacterium]|nr:cobalt ECF transporter T component CbiQ [Spirochaetota bacterium]HOD15139.1 cobalt ECF transporter T component CbiQ [Spirochaetota bacterium]HPG51955.1 cobalt ECF transporter T component CbiQ [Spirochaetota bacterium]HPN12821.1 cobalt ECF transporter T component CbiQ [Spirochaetota bacterium]HQL84073.1 cobalt ECF transporter T component CbiQ [Spirochaetota bacterium]